MRYRRMPIEIESPEQFGYDLIRYNLAESSVTDVPLRDLKINLDDLILAYGDHTGKPELRALIASEGDNLEPGDVLLTVGAAAALFIVNTTLLQAGDHAVIVFPNYATNLETPHAIGANVTRLELRFEDDWQLDLDALRHAIRPETRLVSITNPHNPTGATLSTHDLERIVGMIEASNAMLLVDETYRDMNFSPPPPLAATLSNRVISVSSLSKSYGLPGIRMGWLICQDQSLMETFLAAKEQIFISNSLVDEAIAFQALQQRQRLLGGFRAHIQTNFTALRGWMSAQDMLEWVEPTGGCVCFPRIKPGITLDLGRFHHSLLHDRCTAVGPGHWFGLDDRFMRVGFGWPSRDALLHGLEAIRQAIRDAGT
jgi:aspartate/methionine/tyrosine aminotransferase